MRYIALATDYDGTLATEGRVAPETLAALKRVTESGRKLLLVTGRELDDLKQVFPEMAIFHIVVAENGGLLYDPKTQRERSLTEPPNPRFLEMLTERGIPYSVGRGVVATWEPLARRRGDGGLSCFRRIRICGDVLACTSRPSRHDRARAPPPGSVRG
jgi:hydroxymethylpyrimidine pyrophosphatase-like HAD family hydrolase